MIARASQLFLPTLRDAPADAEAVSHKLLVRAGFIRQVSAGLWSFTPLGWRVHRKIEQIIREEMEAIGAQEWFAPVLTPASCGRRRAATGSRSSSASRIARGRQFVLPLTHEETFTFHAREIQSYRQLPQSWYHFQTKDRDEPRPRGGPAPRPRVHHEGLVLVRPRRGRARRQLPRARGARTTGSSSAAGSPTTRSQAESGMMGGSESVDFLAPSGSGENTLVTCENGDFAADLEVARVVPRAPAFPERLDAPEEVETPGITTIEALAELLGIDPAATSKAMPMVKEDGTVVLALVRGDDRLELGQARRGTAGRRARRRPRTRSARRSAPIRARSGRSGSTARSSPTRRCATGSSSPARTAPAGTCAASSTAATSRRASPTCACRARATRASSAAARCASRPRSRSATSSSSAPATRCRSRRASSTRTARRSRW